MSAMMTMPTAAQFREQMETSFEVTHPSGKIPLRLAGVSEERVAGGFVFFSVFFHGPSDRLLPQATHTMQHPVFGSLDLFIVPVLGSNHERTVYEAAFSRAVEKR
jgi:hypothetical protein